MVVAHSLVAVCGPGATASDELTMLAEQLGRELAQAGLGIICGGRGGVMEAACRGAKAANGLTVGILPTYNLTDANPYLDVVICSGLGEARNTLIVASGAVTIAVGGEWGTLSEIALAIKLGKPVISLASYGWDIRRASNRDPVDGQILSATNPTEAVSLTRHFITSL